MEAPEFKPSEAFIVLNHAEYRLHINRPPTSMSRTFFTEPPVSGFLFKQFPTMTHMDDPVFYTIVAWTS
jgi:hypothetical protein